MFGTEMAARGPALAGQLAGASLAGMDEDGLVEVVAVAERLGRWAVAAQLAAIGALARCRADLRFAEADIAAELRYGRVDGAVRPCRYSTALRFRRARQV